MSSFHSIQVNRDYENETFKNNLGYVEGLKHNNKKSKSSNSFIFTLKEIALLSVFIVMFILAVVAGSYDEGKREDFREKAKTLALSKAFYEQKERELIEMHAFNNALNREFKDKCETAKLLGMPISEACKEVLK